MAPKKKFYEWVDTWMALYEVRVPLLDSIHALLAQILTPGGAGNRPNPSAG
jgi:hypothetical protein